MRGSVNDLWRLAEEQKNASPKPRGYIYCGLADENNFAMNRSLAEHLKENGFACEFLPGEGGHDWAYWDGAICDFLERIGR